jgi:hypothetical protein
MKTRKIALLSAIAVLACVYALQLTLGSVNPVRTVKLADAPDSFVIAKGDGSSITLKKDGDRWLVGEKNYLADASKVEAMISAISPVKILGTVASSGDLDRYGLEETSKITVTALKGEKTLRTLTVGKNAVTGEQSYGIVDANKAVSLLSGGLHDVFGASLDEMRDRAIWNLDASAIAKIDVKGEGKEGSFTLEKSGTPAAWGVALPESAKKAALDASAANSWAQGFAELRADAFAPDGTAPAEKPIAVFTVSSGGKNYALSVLAKDGESRYLCSSPESQSPFYLSAYSVGLLLKPLSELEKK